MAPADRFGHSAGLIRWELHGLDRSAGIGQLMGLLPVGKKDKLLAIGVIRQG